MLFLEPFQLALHVLDRFPHAQLPGKSCQQRGKWSDVSCRTRGMLSDMLGMGYLVKVDGERVPRGRVVSGDYPACCVRVVHLDRVVEPAGSHSIHHFGRTCSHSIQRFGRTCSHTIQERGSCLWPSSSSRSLSASSPAFMASLAIRNTWFGPVGCQ